MNQIAPIQLGPRPAHLPASSDAMAINKAAFANWQSGFPVLSIRGRVWRLRQGGREDPIVASPGAGMAPVPVPYVPAVIVAVATPSAKSYYGSGFDENQMGRRPDCYSIDGVTPDAAAAHKQNPFCQTCRHNQWGSATNSPSGRGKACRDFKRIALVYPHDMDAEMGTMMLQLPPTSVPNLQDYIARLGRVGAAVNQVVTVMKFDLDKTGPTIVFEPHAWLDAEQYARAVELGSADGVRRMLEQEWGEGAEEQQAAVEQPASVVGLPPRPAHFAPAQPETPAPAPEPVQAQAEPVQAPPKPLVLPSPRAITPAPAPVQAQAPAQPIPPTPAPAPSSGAPLGAQVVQGAPADMQQAIDNLLGR